MNTSEIGQQPREWLASLATRHGINPQDIASFPFKQQYFVLKQEFPESEKDQLMALSYKAAADNAKEQLIADGWKVSAAQCVNHVLYTKDNIYVGVLTVTVPASEAKPDAVVAYGVYTYQ